MSKKSTTPHRFQSYKNLYESSKLGGWVYSMGGSAEVGYLLGVTPVCVRQWLNRKATPGLKHTLKIESLSKGKLTPKMILQDTTPKKKSSK